MKFVSIYLFGSRFTLIINLSMIWFVNLYFLIICKTWLYTPVWYRAVIQLCLNAMYSCEVITYKPLLPFSQSICISHYEKKSFKMYRVFFYQAEKTYRLSIRLRLTTMIFIYSKFVSYNILTTQLYITKINVEILT